MSAGKYILVNGTFVPTDEYRLSVSECEAIHFSEQFRAIRSGFPFFNQTLDLIKLKLRLYNQSFPEFTKDDGSGLKRQLERTLTKNKHFLGAKLTVILRFCRQTVYYSIQSETTEPIGFELNEKGLFMEIFDKIQKPSSSLSTLSLGSAAYWDIASGYLSESAADEFLIVNTMDSILEVPGSNIYLIKGKTVRGASSEQGAYVDITKPLMLSIFRNLKLEYSEDEEITIGSIREAEEILAANAIEGIRWIAGFEGKRFFSNTTRKISEMFNQQVSVK